MLSKLQRILPHWLLQKSRRKMMKQLLQANITFIYLFFSEANLLVSCLSPWQGKNKKKPQYEKKTGCECVLPACLQGSDFLYLITDGRGKVEKQTFIAGFSLAWLYFLMRAQTPHSSWPFPAPPPRHLSSLHPPDQELCTHSPRLMSRHRLTISCSAP